MNRTVTICAAVVASIAILGTVVVLVANAIGAGIGNFGDCAPGITR